MSIRSLKDEMSQLIFGQDDLLVESLCAFLAKGHLLITGAPGLAKTTLVQVIASKLGFKFEEFSLLPIYFLLILQEVKFCK